jgi:hypothetical protein
VKPHRQALGQRYAAIVADPDQPLPRLDLLLAFQRVDLREKAHPRSSAIFAA